MLIIIKFLLSYSVANATLLAATNVANALRSPPATASCDRLLLLRPIDDCDRITICEYVISSE